METPSELRPVNAERVKTRFTPIGLVAAIYFAAYAMCFPALWLSGFDMSKCNYVFAAEFTLATMLFFWVMERLLCSPAKK